jgi:predicted ATPase/DNA-binding CsgD family transcriptional regulator
MPNRDRVVEKAFTAPGVLNATADAVPRAAKSTSTATLTKREQEILELIAFGLSNKEIAQRLGLGRRTVESHIDHVLSKLDVSSRARAVVEAGRAGLLGAVAAPETVSPHETRPNNLPFQLTALIGREQDLIDVKILLEGTRLLTLSGSGGVGKTRLALRVGVDLIGLYPDGVWFCDFSPISDPGLVVSVVAHALGVREQSGRPLSEAIISQLKRKQTLLIFDNCEHVLEASAELADEILHACPNISILATSRQALGIMGEVVHRVRSLGLPDEAAGLKANRAMRYGAVALFVDRAMAADTRFTLTNDNAPTVAEICRRVDGIPLAIELAATRVNVVSVRTLAQSLDDRFRVLTAGSRTALPRHQTLSALIDWSYDLLSQQEQLLFDRLSIFAGSFDLEAVQAVCTGSRLEDLDIPDLLIALVDKSLVVAQTGESQERYRLLESTRAYASDKLGATGRREALAHRHAEHFRDKAQAADERFGVGSTATWLANMDHDLENYRAALEWALASDNDPLLGGIIAGNLERLWALAGLSVEARRWIELALERVSETKHAAVAARLWRAKARFLQGQLMRDCTERALALYEKVSDARGAAYALRTLAYSLLQMGKVDETNEVAARAIDALRQQGDDVGVASCLSLQGLIAHYRGDHAAGRAFYTQAVAAYRALGDEAATATTLGNLAELEFSDGQPSQALQLVNEALVIRARGKERTDLTIDLNNSSAYHIALGELDEARESAQEALRWAQAEQNTWNTAVALQHLALLAALRGNARLGAQLLGYVNRQFNDLGLQRETTEQWGHKKLIAALQEQLSAADEAALGQMGATWTEDRVVEEALAT